jgi:transposase
LQTLPRGRPHALTRAGLRRPDAGTGPCLAEAWVEQAERSEVAELRSFATGLRRDWAAVEAALRLPWSNGQTEGPITKLKLLKRSMYSRGSIELLKRRLVLAA